MTHRQSCRRYRFVGLITILMLAAWAGWSDSPAHACDFEEPPPPEEAMEEANAVFSGNVQEIEEVDERDVAVTIQVNQVWKGTGDATVTVLTDRDEAACGFSFEEDESYMVYAYEGDSELRTALYNRTTLLERADEDLDELGEGTPVVETEPTEPDSEEQGPSGLAKWLTGIGTALSSAFGSFIELVREL